PLGTFDHNRFLRIIDQAGFNEQSFIDYIRSTLARDQFIGAASAGLELPLGYARVFFNYLNEARAADYIIVPAAAAGTLPAPSDAALQEYLKAHPNHFSTPEYREVTFAWISPQDLAAEIKVTDAQLRQQYQAQITQYNIPEKRQLEQITFPDMATAEAARAKIGSGTSFSEIARQRGLNSSDIQIGELTKQDLGDRAAAVFALPKDGVTQPLKAPIGFALVHVVSITPGLNRSFEDVKADLRKQVSAQLAASKIADIANQYIDENSRGQPLSKAASKLGMHVGHVTAIDTRGNTPDGTKAQIPSDPELLAQMFKAEVGEEGDPFSAKSGTSFVLKVDGVRPPKLKPLDQVRLQAIAAFQKEQMARRLEQKAKELAEHASHRHSLTAVAATVGAKVESLSPLKRPRADAPNKGPLPPALLNKIFGVPAGTAVYGPTADSTSYIVALVTGVEHPPAVMVRDNLLRRFGGQIGQQAGQDLASGIEGAARAKAGVSINHETVDRMTGESS
ncbi:MAG: peptidyl-prolyl cis-trans isomerase, partial [Alphaproteobacteria bacterium]|nr:peptidyl-prolyl cis-trans isomerase [Alphaproteobacteria bacterium]